jgi:nucleoid-associated protein YgaU
MAGSRLVLTAAVMGLVAVLLAAVTPPVGEMTGTLAAAQRTVDTVGSDAVVVAAAGLLAWAVWAWGCLGLLLTATSAVPGLLGDIARLASRVVLTAGARRSAAVLLGLGLGVAAPVAGAATTAFVIPAAAAAPAGAVPDWPAQPASPSAGADPVTGPPPGRSPAPSPADEPHVVVRGDCLWDVAEARLLPAAATPPTDGEIARAVHAWWTTNADVIGPDADRLLPGQVLRPPGAA